MGIVETFGPTAATLGGGFFVGILLYKFKVVAMAMQLLLQLPH